MTDTTNKPVIDREAMNAARQPIVGMRRIVALFDALEGIDALDAATGEAQGRLNLAVEAAAKRELELVNEHTELVARHRKELEQLDAAKLQASVDAGKLIKDATERAAEIVDAAAGEAQRAATEASNTLAATQERLDAALAALADADEKVAARAAELAELQAKLAAAHEAAAKILGGSK